MAVADAPVRRVQIAPMVRRGRPERREVSVGKAFVRHLPGSRPFRMDFRQEGIGISQAVPDIRQARRNIVDRNRIEQIRRECRIQGMDPRPVQVCAALLLILFGVMELDDGPVTRIDAPERCVCGKRSRSGKIVQIGFGKPEDPAVGLEALDCTVVFCIIIRELEGAAARRYDLTKAPRDDRSPVTAGLLAQPSPLQECIVVLQGTEHIAVTVSRGDRDLGKVSLPGPRSAFLFDAVCSRRTARIEYREGPVVVPEEAAAVARHPEMIHVGRGVIVTPSDLIGCREGITGLVFAGQQAAVKGAMGSQRIKRHVVEGVNVHGYCGVGARIEFIRLHVGFPFIRAAHHLACDHPTAQQGPAQARLRRLLVRAHTVAIVFQRHGNREILIAVFPYRNRHRHTARIEIGIVVPVSRHLSCLRCGWLGIVPERKLRPDGWRQHQQQACYQ